MNSKVTLLLLPDNVECKGDECNGEECYGFEVDGFTGSTLEAIDLA